MTRGFRLAPALLAQNGTKALAAHAFRSRRLTAPAQAFFPETTLAGRRKKSVKY